MSCEIANGALCISSAFPATVSASLLPFTCRSCIHYGVFASSSGSSSVCLGIQQTCGSICLFFYLFKIMVSIGQHYFLALLSRLPLL